jgi:chromosomal replication initiator protein
MSDQFSLEDSEGHVRLSQAWKRTLERLAKEPPDKMLAQYLRAVRPVAVHEGVALLEVSTFYGQVIQSRYGALLAQVLSEELREKVAVSLRPVPVERPKPEAAQATVALTPIVDRGRFTPNDRYRFDTFIVGQSNRLAVAGAKAVAERPGEAYNPLFIYGGSGLGKTHLLHSIAHEVLGRDGRFRLAYISAQQFAEEFVVALQAQKMEQFRRVQRNVNLWLVDDIQFVAGRDKTLEEIFHTFNHLHQYGKQIVVCSDRPPRELHLMEERLRSRFESGLVADIQSPDTETRCAILLLKAEHQGVPLDQEVAMFLAEHVPGNVRVLEGALHKLAARASLLGQPVSVELAAQIVETDYSAATLAKPGIQEILDVVSKFYKVSAEEMQGPSRKAPIAHARHVAVYLARQITMDSWKHLGSQFGDRDHTSMMHAYQKISEMMLRDKDFSASVKKLMAKLHPNA